MTVDFEQIAATISPDQLATAIGAEKVRDSYRCPQPSHSNGDRSPSLSISRKEGRTVACCHGCGLSGTPVQVAAEVWRVTSGDASERLARAIGLGASGPSPNGLGEPTDRYEYTDEELEKIFGAIEQQVALTRSRFEDRKRMDFRLR